MEHTLKSLLRDAAILAVSFGSMWWLRGYLTGHKFMSGDAVADGIVTAIFTIIAVVVLFGALFVVEALFVVPRQIWMELRPRAAPRSENFFMLDSSVMVETTPTNLKDSKGREIYANDFYMTVGNALPSGRTLRRVQCRLFSIGEPVLCFVKEMSRTEIDIRNGELALFYVGRIVSFRRYGMIKFPREEIPESRVQSYVHNLGIGYHSFEAISAPSGKAAFGFADYPGAPEHGHKWDLLAVVSADDVPAMQVSIKVDLRAEHAPVAVDRAS